MRISVGIIFIDYLQFTVQRENVTGVDFTKSIPGAGWKWN